MLPPLPVVHQEVLAAHLPTPSGQKYRTRSLFCRSAVCPKPPRVKKQRCLQKISPQGLEERCEPNLGLELGQLALPRLSAVNPGSISTKSPGLSMDTCIEIFSPLRRSAGQSLVGKTKIESFRPRIFCWYSRFWSMVRKASNSASTACSNAPFFKSPTPFPAQSSPCGR